MSHLTDQVLDQLDPATIQQIAAQLGVDPQQAQTAIQQALPLVVGGLARGASTDAGASAIHSAAADHAGLDIGSMLGSMLGGGTTGAGGGSAPGGVFGGAGGSILGSIFGNRQDQATQGLGQASGLGTQNAAQLLAMLVPIVLSVLGNLSQRQGMSPGGLGSTLGQESQRIDQTGHGGLLGSVLDQDGDGKIGLGDLFKVGAEMLGSRGRA